MYILVLVFLAASAPATTAVMPDRYTAHECVEVARDLNKGNGNAMVAWCVQAPARKWPWQ